MSRNFGIPPRLDIEMLCENGAIKATKSKPRKMDITAYVVVAVVFLLAWFLLGVGSGDWI